MLIDLASGYAISPYIRMLIAAPIRTFLPIVTRIDRASRPAYLVARGTASATHHDFNAAAAPIRTFRLTMSELINNHR
jgi:hypothetical protein